MNSRLDLLIQICYNIISESENNMNYQELIFNMMMFLLIAGVVRIFSKLLGV